jgi:hypothetical protein
LLFVSACVLTQPRALLAQAQAPPAQQQTAAGAAPDVDPDNPQDPTQPQRPLTPEEQRAKQIRQFDPLDRTAADKEAKAREKAAREAEKDNAKQNPPLPGSIAADDAQRAGPRVAESDGGDEPVQEYTGPAVLSRSYSVNRPLIPQELKWNETVGFSAVYDSGLAAFTPSGSVTTSSPVGTNLNWSLSGRHYFGHDQIAVSYSGGFAQYAESSGLTGLNNALAVDYSHVFSRRFSVNLGVDGMALSQNYALINPEVGPNTTVANVNLGTSPNVQITDNGVKQMSLQADFVWQKTARLSFDGGGSYFMVVRDTPGLLGMTGSQGHVDVNYRLTRKMTVGSYYSVSEYTYEHGYGTSHVNTVGAIYSYAFSKSLQLRVRGGISYIDGVGYQQIPVAPSIAALLGVNFGIVDVSSNSSTSDISAQIVKDFGRSRTVNVAYAHGIAPGNGLFQTSTQENISASFAARIFRRYDLQLGLGYTTLSSVTEALGTYRSDYARISISRPISRAMSASFSVDLRHYDITNFTSLQNEFRLSAGISWNRSGRLLPF